ncbi:N-myc proto-oncogene protein [Cylas formicarius]|uniref:N-myc proto-oncogene protein n=1 Tax=Cylas formicarius TaxID=197179 RepID=UPI0029587B8D|nr:N-myc proto-oncogene protein [Cylas formicarius]XP_060520005.1 N-myc proto-oncogene protein [Cylas formicarius]
MIVKSEPYNLDAIDPFPMMSSAGDVDNDFIVHPNSVLLPDDIWKKFELDFPELTNIDGIFQELDDARDDNMGVVEEYMLHHDCMWAGHCASDEHPPDDFRMQSLNFIVPKPPVINTRTMNATKMKAQQQQQQQQSLLKPSVRATAASTTTASSNSALQHALQTPPESDDEEGKGKPSKLLQILNQAISEYDIDEDSDLCDYFEDTDVDGKNAALDIKEEPLEIKQEPVGVQEEPWDVADVEDEEAQRKTYQKRLQIATENDHSYYKDKNASMMVHMNCGLDTPSDSEEEIDVVSVPDKLLSNSRMVFSLPTNPSNKDRQQLQRRVATAISKKKINNNGGSIKTILPVRKPYASEPVAKRKASDGGGGTRGIKRGRYGTKNGGGAYKRKSYSNSDSEQEPSEKRNLHNNMERQRRIDLRNAFEDLRVLVPEVCKKDRAAKVVILKEAAQYCDGLTRTSQSCTRQIDELKRRQEWLRSRVSQLRRNLAAKR